jgi:hypothetical protein
MSPSTRSRALWPPLIYTDEALLLALLRTLWRRSYQEVHDSRGP